MSDLGDVTLVIDDDKRIQAHKLVQVLVLFIQSLCIPSSWIQLGSWVGNLFPVLVLLYSFQLDSARILGLEPVSGPSPFFSSV